MVRRAAAVVAPTGPAPAPIVRPVVAPVVQPTPFAQNPINQLRGNARALLLFAPDTISPYVRTQMAVLSHHELELTERDTVFVPIMARQTIPLDRFPGENLDPGAPGDQMSARQRFGLRPNDFAVILLDQDGREVFRSNLPVSVEVLTARLDGE